MQPARYRLKIYKNNTFTLALRWETDEKIYIPINSVSKSAPAQLSTNTAHGLPPEWRVKVYGLQGMKELNNTEVYLDAKVTGATSLEFNSINSNNYTAYTGGGTLEYNAPMDFTGFNTYFYIKNSRGDLLYSASSVSGDIVLNNTLKTITLTIPANITSGFDFINAEYELVFIDSSNNAVNTILSGIITIV